MWEWFKDFICPAKAILKIKQQLLDDLLKYSSHQAKETQKLEATIQRLTDVVANKKTSLSTTIDKLSVSSHAIHRYRERHNGKGSDKDIEQMLYKCLLQHLHIMDTLPDGKYSLKKGVVGAVANNTLVSVLPERAKHQ